MESNELKKLTSFFLYVMDSENLLIFKIVFCTNKNGNNKKSAGGMWRLPVPTFHSTNEETDIQRSQVTSRHSHRPLAENKEWSSGLL